MIKVYLQLYTHVNEMYKPCWWSEQAALLQQSTYVSHSRIA